MTSIPDDTDTERQALKRDIALAVRENSTAAVLFHGAIAERLGLAATEMKTLGVLARHGPLTAGAIAQQTGLATASVTSLIDRLEQKGFVRRVHDTVDRRRIIVEPIPERLAETDLVFSPMQRALDDLLAPYSDEQLAVIRDFIRRATAYAREEIARLADERARLAHDAAGR